LLVALLQLTAISLVVFFVIRALPADPVARLVGFNASPEVYAQSKQALGLDEPVLKQLGLYLGFYPSEQQGLLQGNLGESWVSGSPITV
jgi:ABC-type dipeptide/oligopeptide/nickel transport system permease component